MAFGEPSARVFRDRYRLLELVGEGANARVYTADDLTLRRRVAVKVLSEDLARNEGFRQRFEQEMRAAASLSFPRLLPVYDWGLDPRPYIVTEHVNGGSLAGMLSAGHRLSPSQALSVGLEVARALVKIHRAGRAYCGLTASSIMFDSEARVFVSDLGVAAALSAAAAQPATQPATSAAAAEDGGTARAATPGTGSGGTPTGGTPTGGAAGGGAGGVGGTGGGGVSAGAGVADSGSDAAGAASAGVGSGTVSAGTDGAFATADDTDAEDGTVADDGTVGEGGRVEPDESDPWGVEADAWNTEVWDLEAWAFDDLGTSSSSNASAATGDRGAPSDSGRSPADRQLDADRQVPADRQLGTGRQVPADRQLDADQRQDVHDVALIITEAVTGDRRAPGARDGSLSASVMLGPLQSALEQAAADPADRLDAAGLAEELLRVARLLPRPDPLPIAGATAAPGSSGPLPAPEADAGRDGWVVPASSSLSPIPRDDVLRRRWPGLVLAVTLVLGGGAAGVWGWIESRPETIPVPELAGLTRTAATGVVAEHGWEAESILVREPGTRPGRVVRTEPVAGTELGDGAALALFVSLGEPLVRLDFDVYGHTVPDAAELLHDRGLVAADELPVNDEAVPPGLVVALDLPEGVHELEGGSEVGLLVSEGPAARTVPEVPEDRTPIAAVEALFDARLEPREMTEFSNNVPAGEVIGFHPPSGQAVEADSVVDIRVSVGPEPEPEPEPEPANPANPADNVQPAESADPAQPEESSS